MDKRDDALADRLAHVYWLGGGSGAGKSTIARRLAVTYGLRLYDTDAAMADHAARCRPQDCPSLTAFKGMSMDERWLNRSPAVMLETFHWFRGEGFDLIVEDLLALPTSQRIIVEGFRLLPLLVIPLLADRRQAAWLVPTPAFRLAAFASRGALLDIAGKTSAPERALDNLLQRDGLFTARIEREARAAGLLVLGVDSSTGIDGLASRVADRFGLRVLRSAE
jgi:hypothetical protein